MIILFILAYWAVGVLLTMGYLEYKRAKTDYDINDYYFETPRVIIIPFWPFVFITAPFRALGRRKKK